MVELQAPTRIPELVEGLSLLLLERDDFKMIRFVVASEARQSIRVVQRVDCRVAALLAKTIQPYVVPL